MLGSSSCSHNPNPDHQQPQNQEEVLHHLQPDPPLQQLQNHHTPPSTCLRQLLLACAHSISTSDFTAAHRITAVLSSNSSPHGDSSERVVHFFTKALSLRLLRHLHLPPPPCSTDRNNNNNDGVLQSSFLTLNQITPFIRFTQLTANQAILEAIEEQNPNHDIHVLDFDIMHGVQWPPLMQAISVRRPPPTLRITATGTDLDTLRRTGDRLAKFAHSLGLRFRFFPLLIPNNNNSNNNNNNYYQAVDDVINRLSAVLVLPNEILAVNFVLYLHRLLVDRDKLVVLLQKIKSMNPKVVTLAEKETNILNHPVFVTRFEEALNYYTAVFESLEVTLPPNSRERMAVEEVWFGREIEEVVMKEGERDERFLTWEMMMKMSGFRNVELSPFAVAQAKLLLRLHYPCEGYNLEVVNDSFVLGWNNQPLFSVSSWH